MDCKELWSREQRQLRQQLVLHDDFDWSVDPDACTTQQVPETVGVLNKQPLRLVGGVDISFVGADTSLAHSDGPEQCLAALVVLSFPELAVVYEDYVRSDLAVPYIPGYLGFREVPAYMTLLQRVQGTQYEPQVLLVDGCGMLHPESFGSASHLGVVCDIPTVGVAKSLMLVPGLQPANEHTVRSVMALAQKRAATTATAPAAPMAITARNAVDLPVHDTAVEKSTGKSALAPTTAALAAVLAVPPDTPVDNSTMARPGNILCNPAMHLEETMALAMVQPDAQIALGQANGVAIDVADALEATRRHLSAAGVLQTDESLSQSVHGAAGPTVCSASSCSADAQVVPTSVPHICQTMEPVCSVCHHNSGRHNADHQAPTAAAAAALKVKQAGLRADQVQSHAGDAKSDGTRVRHCEAFCAAATYPLTSPQPQPISPSQSAPQPLRLPAVGACPRQRQSACLDQTAVNCEGWADSIAHNDAAVKGRMDWMLQLRSAAGMELGMALCTGNVCRPIYVSSGHRIGLATAVQLVRRCCKHRIPEPVRQADLRSRELLRV